MRIALILIAAFAGAVALGFVFLWPASDEAAQDEAALPVYLGGEGEEGEGLDEQPFGGGATVCSLDPRYRPKPGVAQSCPAIH